MKLEWQYNGYGVYVAYQLGRIVGVVSEHLRGYTARYHYYDEAGALISGVISEAIILLEDAKQVVDNYIFEV